MLCQSFINAAKFSWDTLGRGARCHLSIGEETITDMILLRLAHGHPREIAIHKYARQEEAKSGADWEWWFLGPSTAFGMRVQAKRLHCVGQEYESLRDQEQLTRLIDKAKAAPRRWPAVCFYNHWAVRHANNSVRSLSRGTKPISRWGCAIAPATRIECCLSKQPGKIGRSLHTVLPWCKPWDILVCGGAHANTNTADKVAVAAAAAVDDAVSDDWLVCREATPPYVLSLSDGGTPRDPLKDESLAGIVVVQTMR